jgi:hypothetical protein
MVTAQHVTVALSTSSRANANEPWSPPHAVVLMGAIIYAICSVIQSMDLVVGCPMMVSSGFAAMMR